MRSLHVRQQADVIAFAVCILTIMLCTSVDATHVLSTVVLNSHPTRPSTAPGITDAASWSYGVPTQLAGFATLDP